MIDRGFVRIDEGLVHYRQMAGPSEGLPLFMLHAGPVSSLSLEPLMQALPDALTLYAPDTLGFGDSAPPAPHAPDIDYYADSAVRVMDALGLQQVDVYGSHTGANIGCEIAIRHPKRVRKLVLEGVGLFDTKTRQDLLDNYAPKKIPDEYGSHLLWAWHFLRDQSLYYPYYKKDPAHRLDTPIFPTELLHNFAVDVLKALRTYHKGYNAVFAHDIAARLPCITQETVFMAHNYDPMKTDVTKAMALLPGAAGRVFTPNENLADQAIVMQNFLK